MLLVSEKGGYKWLFRLIQVMCGYRRTCLFFSSLFWQTTGSVLRPAFHSLTFSLEFLSWNPQRNEISSQSWHIQSYESKKPPCDLGIVSRTITRISWKSFSITARAI